MAISVLTYINTRAPHYAGDSRLSDFIAQATVETDALLSTDLTNKAIALLVLHWMTLADRDESNSGITGAVKREKEGKLEREYLQDYTLLRDHADFAQTTWGIELLRIRRSSIVGPMNRFTTW